MVAAEHEWASEEDYGRVYDYGSGEPEPEAARYPAPSWVPLDDFAERTEPTATALLGSAAEPLLAAGGMLIMYGDGGAGKTTLTLDAVAHMAAGVEWLGIPCPDPVRVGMVENEGPRGMFRLKVLQKIETWRGEPFGANVTILEEPWTRFSLRDRRHQSSLAEMVLELDVSLVVMGPLVTLGMVGGGTPDEIMAFENCLAETRDLAQDHPFAWWIVHHENKSGDVSGAWERVPDVLCHVQGRGHGRTHLTWRKARWSSTLHGTSVDLTWADGHGYSLAEAPPERDLYAELPGAMPGDGSWSTGKELAQLIGAREESVREVAAALAESGALEYAVGPPGRHHSARCWRLAGTGQARIGEGPGEPGPSGDGLDWR